MGRGRCAASPALRLHLRLFSAAMALTVLPVPCLRDNYAYLLHAAGSDRALVVDPSEAEPVRGALARHGLSLAGVLATHHHHDHVGGIAALREAHPGLDVVASAYDRERVPCVTKTVLDDERFELGGLSIHALLVPGHTLGAVAFVVDDAVFTGDTLFVAGCGRLFEGTPADMHRSLSTVLGGLPADTRVYCGHEYTVNNARFAKTVDPDNAAVDALLAEAEAKRGRGEATVPSTIGRERATNPFLRVAEPALRARYASEDPVAVLAAVRKAKDAF